MKVNYEGFECKVLGKEKYKEILNRHNIFTKKHTIGRVKPCIQELREEIKEKLGGKK